MAHKRRFSAHVRLRSGELRQIKRCARAAGLSLSEFFRRQALARAAHEIPERDGPSFSHVSPRREAETNGK